MQLSATYIYFKLLEIEENLVDAISSYSLQTQFFYFLLCDCGRIHAFRSLYLEDQGFNYQEIGILSSIAIVTRFLRHLFGDGLQTNPETHVAGAYSYWMEACIWFMIFIIPNSFRQSLCSC